MSQPDRSQASPDGLLAARRLNRACDAFEAAWRAGSSPPDLAQHLDTVEPAERPALLRELVALDAYYRRGQAVSSADYLARFPELDPVWLNAALGGASAAPGRAEQTAVSTPTGDSVLAALFGADAGAAPRVLLRDMPEHLTPLVAPGPDRMGSSRYQLLGEIARGGMGVVLKGRDNDLGRDLAVKVLLEEHRGKPELLHRFVEEAQIGGQLQHPGVAPVYELGALPDRRPFFAMKLVKGRTLAALLAERPEPAHDLPRFLKVFEQMCQTVAYAHARGVIHRDLKPSNIMVGAFGEVQVMDWGLAKVLACGGTADERRALANDAVSIIRTVRSAGLETAEPEGSHTHVGSVMGTPAYMAPEQARGEIDQVDERSDVFGLGAILCEILTGKPPYSGRAAEVYRQAARADLATAHARLESCGADVGLIDLARRCLTAAPLTRPRDAGVLTSELTAYLESVEQRLRRAELERARADVRAREEGKRRRLTAGLAAAVLCLVVLGAGSALYVQDQKAERRAEAERQEVERRQAVVAVLDKAADLQRQARWKEATAVLDQAETRLAGKGPDDLQRRLARARADLTLVARLDATRLQAATTAGRRLNFEGARQEYAAALAGSLFQEGETAAATADRLRGSAVRVQVVAALDDWARMTSDPERLAWLLEVARRADPDPWRDQFRDPAVRRDRAALERLARAANVEALAPSTLAALADALWQQRADGLPLLTRAQARYPDDFWLNFLMGNALGEAKKSDEAIGYYRAALALRPDAVAVYNNLGTVRSDSGLLDEAIAAFEQATILDPKNTRAHRNLGNVLVKKGRLDDAITVFGKARDLEPTDPLNYNNLGVCLSEKGLVDAAIATWQKALTLDPKFLLPYFNLGEAFLSKGRLTEARDATGNGLKMLPEGHPLRPKVAAQLRRCEQMLALDATLPAFLKGETQPASLTEGIEFAWLCKYKQFYASSARLFGNALAGPKLPAEQNVMYSYQAASAAVQAGCGLGKDAAQLDESARAHLRKQSLTWLNAALAMLAEQLQGDQPEEREQARQLIRSLRIWQDHPDLACVRDTANLAKLPEAERLKWRKLWDDVSALMARAVRME